MMAIFAYTATVLYFVNEDQRLISLFEEDTQNLHLPVMKAMDAMNKKFGKHERRKYVRAEADVSGI